MGKERSKSAFSRPACYRKSEWEFRIFEGCLLSGNTEDQTAGNERERDRVRERYPSFQKRDAHALRFGSMNPISRVSGPGSRGGESCKGSNPALYLGKSYNVGGYLLFFIAGMK